MRWALVLPARQAPATPELSAPPRKTFGITGALLVPSLLTLSVLCVGVPSLLTPSALCVGALGSGVASAHGEVEASLGLKSGV
jgi:hypothetical protein